MAHPESATRGHPATLVGSTTIVSGTSWTVVHETDFTVAGAASPWDAHTAGNLATQDINGVRWNVDGVGYCTDMDLDSNGLSIHIAGSETASDWWTGGKTAPRFFAYLTYGTNPIYSSAGYGQAFCFQMLIESSTDVSANWDAYGLLVSDHYGSSATESVQNRRIYDSAGKNGVGRLNGGGQMELVAGSQPTMFETVVANGTVFVSSSTASSLPDPMTITGYRAVANNNTARNTLGSSMAIDKDNLCVLFYAFQAGGSTTNFTPTLKKFRVLATGATGALG